MLKNFQSDEAIVEQLEQGYIYKTVVVEGEPAGYIAVKPEYNRLFLSKVYLDKKFRGKGIGKKMIEEAQRLADGSESIYLTVNKENAGSIAVYKKTGFEIIDRATTDIGGGYVMDDYIMELKLK